jgi:hypothetical protein
MFVGIRYVQAFRAAGERPGFYQEAFGPAVMQACGRGFVNPAPRAIPSLDPFLATTSEAFDCRVVPQSFNTLGLTSMQETHRYLLTASAGCWRVLGVRWSALDLLAGGLFASTAVALYLACRVVAGRILAAVLTVLAIISPVQLGNLPHIRDYSKAPFFVATAAGLAWLMSPRPVPAILAIAVAVGALSGIGIGFRTDVLLYLLPFLAGLLVCSPEDQASKWRVRAAAFALCVGACVVVAWPVLRAYSSGQNIWHVALLGLTTPYDDQAHLGIRRSLYEFGDQYLDQYVHSVVNNYWDRVHHASISDGAMYAAASGEYYRRLFLTFPADFVTRAWAAVLKSFELPVDSTAVRIVPAGITGEWLRSVFWARWRLFSWLQPLALPTLVVLAVGLSTRRRLAAACLLGFIALSAGITSLQFQGRHNFQIELFVYWIFAAAGGWLTAVLSKQKERSAGGSQDGHSRMLRAVIFAVSFGAAVLLPLIVLRAYQRRTVSALLTHYEEAPAAPVEILESAAHGVVSLRMPSLATSSAASSTQMIVTTLDTRACRDSVDLTFRYANDLPDMAVFTRVMHVDTHTFAPGTTKVLFPVYFTNIQWEGHVSFVGLEVPETQRNCIRSVSRFSDPEKLSLLLTTFLPADWRTLPLYQRIDSLE